MSISSGMHALDFSLIEEGVPVLEIRWYIYGTYLYEFGNLSCNATVNATVNSPLSPV